MASMRRGPVELMLSAARAGASGVSDRARLYLRCEDVMQVRARATAAGIAVRGPFVRFYQMKEIELRDPDGFLVIVGAETDEAPTPEASAGDDPGAAV